MIGRPQAATRRVAALCGVLVLGLAACTQSRLAPDEAVTVGGKLTDGGGAPLAGTNVELRAELTGMQVIGGLGTAFATVGLACAAEPKPGICRDDTRHAATDAEGTFQFDLTGGDAQDSVGTARTFSLSAAAPPRDDELSGPATAMSFLIQTPDLALGPVATWRPRLTVGSDDGTARVAWQPRQGAGDHTVTFDDGHGAVVWQQRGPGRVAFDARLLEGYSGGVSALARTSGPGPHTEITTTYRSPRLAFSSASPPPPSRGARCTVEASPDRSEPRRPCPLTDGDLEPEGLGGSTTIDLGKRLRATLLAVRGCEDGATCTVERSIDGKTWAPLATVNRPFAARATPEKPEVRYLRVRSSRPSLRLAEVSVWDDAPVKNRALAIVPPDAIGAPRTGPATADDGPPWLWLGLGAGAVVLAAAAIGFRLGRRRTADPVSPGQQS